MLALAKKMNDPTSVTGDLNTIGTILLEYGHAQEAQANSMKQQKRQRIRAFRRR